jgi:hypothetical protein
MDDQVITIPLAGETDETDTKPVDADVVLVPETDAEAEKLPAHATELPDGRVVLPIKRPVTLKIKEGAGDVREQIYDTFTFHRLTGADMRAIQNAGKNSATVAIARSVRIRPLIFDRLHDQMDGADVMSCAQVISYFLDNGSATGP